MKKIILSAILLLCGCNPYMTPQQFANASKLCEAHQGMQYAWPAWSDGVSARCVDGVKLQLSTK